MKRYLLEALEGILMFVITAGALLIGNALG